MSTGTIPVTERAIVARLKRFLARDDFRLVRSRNPETRATAGELFVLDVRENAITEDHHLDLEEFARKMGVLQAYEHLSPSVGRKKRVEI
jgi:hypothetical protein